MPTSPASPNVLIREMIARVEAAEQQMVARVAASLAKGDPTAPDWVLKKQLELQRLRQALERDAQALTQGLQRDIPLVVGGAYDWGAVDAQRDLREAGQALGEGVLPDARMFAIQAIAADLQRTMEPIRAKVLRSATDAYQRVVAQGVSSVLLGAETRRQVTQRAVNQLLGEGITVFTDRRGRDWSLPTYVEMATRTGVAKAAVDGHVETLTRAGQDRVHIIPGPYPCPVCDKWASSVLYIHAADGTPSLESARFAGWGHPNCRCSVALWVEGFSELVTERPSREGYADDQEQRRIERGIRKWKLREASALTPAEKAKAAAKVREWQGDMRAHLAAHPGLKRQPKREALFRGSPTPPSARGPVPTGPVSPVAPVPPPAVRTWLDDVRDARDRIGDRSTIGIKSLDVDTWRAERLKSTTASILGNRTLEEWADIAVKREAEFTWLGQVERDLDYLTSTQGISAEVKRRLKDEYGVTMVGGIKAVKNKVSALRDTAWRQWSDANAVPAQHAYAVKRLQEMSDEDIKASFGHTFRSNDIDPTGELGPNTKRALDSVLEAGQALNKRAEEIAKQLATEAGYGHLARIPTTFAIKGRRQALAEARAMGGGARPEFERARDVKEPRDHYGLDELKKMATAALDKYPTEWNDLYAAKVPKVALGLSRRGYNSRGGQVVVTSGDMRSQSQETMTHEMGHSMEHAVPGLMGMQWAYWYTRSSRVVNGRRILDQREEIYPGSGEVGIRDSWIRAYSGKDYRRYDAALGAEENWEVFQTGVQSVFHGADYATQDKEFLDFVMGVLGVL